MPAQTAVPLAEFRAANWEAFAGFEQSFERRFTQYSRSLPSRFYKSIRDDLNTIFGKSAGLLASGQIVPNFRFKVVVDSNIIIQDSLAVAGGKPSTTNRILASPFVKVLAPSSIREECIRIIRARSKRRGVSTEVALHHAETLLRRIELVDPKEDPFVRKARDLIGSHSPEDVSFLAVALEFQTTAVVSRDKVAFDAQTVTRRWELRNLVESVVTFESGSLSVVLVGTGATVLLRALQTVVVAIAGAVFELLTLALRALAALVEGALDALARVPAWGWLAVAVVLVGVGIYAAQHPEFRDKVSEGIAALTEGIRKLGSAIVQAGAALLQGLHEVLVFLWNLLLPVTAATVIVAGVLLRRMNALMTEATRLQSRVPGT